MNTKIKTTKKTIKKPTKTVAAKANSKKVVTASKAVTKKSVVKKQIAKKPAVVSQKAKKPVEKSAHPVKNTVKSKAQTTNYTGEKHKKRCFALIFIGLIFILAVLVAMSILVKCKDYEHKGAMIIEKSRTAAKYEQ